MPRSSLPVSRSSKMLSRLIDRSRSDTDGATLRKRASSPGITATSMESARPTLNVRSAVEGSNASRCSTAAWIWASVTRTGSASASARGVGRMPSAPRVSSSSPNSVLSRARLWLIADWPSPTRAAARVTLRSVSSASNATNRLRSSRLRLAWSILVIDIIDWNDDTGAPMFRARPKRPSGSGGRRGSARRRGANEDRHYRRG